MAVDRQQLLAVCRELLGREPDAVSAPGGDSRDSLRARYGDQSLFVSCRANEARCRREAAALRALQHRQAPVPRLIAHRDCWLIQQDVGSERLSEALAKGDAATRLRLLAKAVASLITIHDSALDMGLQRHFPVLGATDNWLEKLLNRRRQLAEYVSVPAPDLPGPELLACLRVRTPRFIKWDARPGNAIVNAAGAVIWIDWEHCGCRNPVDDLVWLLADEYTPDPGEMETTLLGDWLPHFSRDWAPGEAWDYFHTYAVLHGIVRLCYIMRYKGDGPWWDAERCLRLDKVGINRVYACALCERLQRWAGRSPYLSGWQPWLAEVHDRIAALP